MAEWTGRRWNWLHSPPPGTESAVQMQQQDWAPMDFGNEYVMTIDGEAVAGATTFPVINPATGAAFAAAPDCSAEQLDRAVVAANRAFRSWRETPIATRQQLLCEAAELLAAHADELARLFTREQGRPVEGARSEITGAAEWMRAVAQMQPPVLVSEDSATQRVETRYVPLGVVCAIAPWNFPVNLALWKVAPALVAGNTLVLKPSPYTPLCTLRIGELFNRVLPPGVFNVISGGNALGPMMTAHPGFAKISFTGSTATGKRVMESAARDLKRVTLELGGNDAAIVLPDVGLDAVAQNIFMAAFYNTAQICVATKRLYVHTDIYDALRDRLVAIARAVKVGDGARQGTVLGPIQNRRQYERVLALLDDAREWADPDPGGRSAGRRRLFRAGDDCRRSARRCGGGAGGGVRADPADAALCRCGRRHRPRQCQPLWAWRLGVVGRHRARNCNCAALGNRHGLGQPVHHHAAGYAICRA